MIGKIKSMVKNHDRISVSNSIVSVVFVIIISIVCIRVIPNKMKELIHAIKSGTYNNEFATIYETELNESFPLKNYFIDINGLAHRAFLQREMNDVILLKNGHEHMLMEDRPDELIAENADSLKGLSVWLEERGISFFWCQVPQKLDEYAEQLPAGLEDYSNRVADVFLSYLDERGVRYLDLRESIKTDSIDRYSLFLSTEHHWSARGGFYAFQKICDYLRNNYDEEIPEYFTDLGNYNIVTYNNGSLGYYGQRTGWMFGGFDDFDLIYPKWETHQSSWAPHKELLREGSFYDAIFYTDYLDDSWRDRGLYRTYIGGDWPLVVHHSDTAPINKTIMILIDSYGTIPESFLTTVYKNVIAVDLRWVLRNHIEKTTAEYVEEYNPDIVIVMLNPNQIGLPDFEQFKYGIEEPSEQQ